MNLASRTVATLMLIATTGCSSPSTPAYCVNNVIDLQPLHVGDSWRPRLGTLDDAQSNCSLLESEPALSWTTAPATVIESRPDGGLVGLTPGAFTATASDDAGVAVLQLQGFVMPDVYRLHPPLEDLRLTVNEEYTLPVQVVDANGQPLQDAWLFASPGDIGVLWQRGCLPRRGAARCVLEGRVSGTTALRVSVGRVSQTISVTVD